MNKPALRTLAVLGATLFAIAAPIVQNGADIGLSAAEFSRQGDETLRAAGYAFSIWSLIYIGLLVYAVWQALPRTGESPLLRAVGWPSAIGIAGCGLWIFVTAADLRWATVMVIVASAAAILIALWRAGPETDQSRRWIVLWPLGLLGGWLTAASALNILTVADMEGLIDNSTAAAIAGLTGVAVIALAIIARTRSLPYALAVLWALAAVFVAERADKPPAAWFAVACAVVILVAWIYARRRRRA